MEGKAKKKVEGRKGSVTVTLTGIPRTVHNWIQKYRRKINSERQKDYNLKDSYVEFLKEATKNYPMKPTIPPGK